jgi:hypothetical protein
LILNNRSKKYGKELMQLINPQLKKCKIFFTANIVRKPSEISSMPSVHIPTIRAEEWRALLADPQNQWRAGYSAKELAECWLRAEGFPPEIQRLFAGADNPTLHEIEMLLAIPEYQVQLPDGKRPSQNDLFVLARARDNRLAAIMVEGKVSEPFGPTLKDWQKDGSVGKERRLRLLCDILGVTEQPKSTIRYQLLHRTASAILTAKKFNAGYAVMAVHSFSPQHKWLEDYQDFLRLFEVTGGVGKLTRLTEKNGIQVYSGWVTGNSS